MVYEFEYDWLERLSGHYRDEAVTRHVLAS